MSKILTSNLCPADHPVSNLPLRLRLTYLRGVGAALLLIPTDERRMQKARFCYDRLCRLLIGRRLDNGWWPSENGERVKKAQSLFWEGLRPIRVADCFWWDVYRIAWLSDLDITQTKLDQSLQSLTNLFTRGYPEAAKKHFFHEGDGGGLSAVLTAQSSRELAFRRQPLKKILIVGTMSAGKSTLLNALTGRKIAKVRSMVCTTQISYIYNNPFSDHIACTKGREYVNLADSDPALDSYSRRSVRFQGQLGGQRTVLVDTPGVNYALDPSHAEMSYTAIGRKPYDVLVCVCNGKYMDSNDEYQLIKQVLKQTDRKIIFVINKLDSFDPDDDSIEDTVAKFRHRLGDKGAKATVIPVSARAAYLFRREPSGSLSAAAKSELDGFRQRLALDYYDLGRYATGRSSADGDWLARTGILTLENAILNI